VRPIYSYTAFCELRVSCLALSFREIQTIVALVFGASTLTLAQGTVLPEAPVAGESLAVVAFANITGESGDDWIGIGIAETLSTELERVGRLSVFDRSSVSAVLKTLNARDEIGDERQVTLEAGRRLGADWIVEGSYQRSGDLIRITAGLVRVETASVVRTAKVDGSLVELFSLQDRLVFELMPSSIETSVQAAAQAAATREETSLSEVGSTDEPSSNAAMSPLLSDVLIDGPPPPEMPDLIARDADGRVTMRAVRLSESWSLDGSLDEEVYNQVAPVSGFIQQLPDEGDPATEKTEVWVFFDQDNVYIASRLWDSAPEAEWIANDMRRDSFQIIDNDTFSVAFDTFYDRRNGVAFMVNPIEGFFDYEISDEGTMVNSDWNPVWDVKTSRFDGGWTVEMEIPFKSLRYRQGEAQVWGVQFGRRVRRKNESSHLTPVSISAGPGMFRLSAAGTLVGMEVPASNTRFDIKPYGIGSAATDLTADPVFKNRGDGDWGVDAKWGVTQNLTADFTYNTDFAQVEVDEQQVNLTRFSLFFPEKREFFLESRGIFDFGTGPRPLGRGQGTSAGGRGAGPAGQGGGTDAPTLFFSRRIGLEAGQTVPIQGGGRLTGKVGRFSIGALNIQTDNESVGNALATNFTVVRLKRDILRRSRIGGMFTRRSVSLTGNGANEVYGVDGAFSFYDNVNFNGYYSRTRTPGLQGDDTSYQGAFTYSGDLYGFQVDHLLVGDNFNPEVGFLRRDDFRRTFVAAQFSPRPRSLSTVRQFTWGGSLDYIQNGSEQLETRLVQARFKTEFENSDQFDIDILKSYELLTQPFEIASNVTIPIGGYGFQDLFLSYSLGQQRRFSGSVFVQRGEFFSGDITAYGYRRGRMEVTPQLSVEPTVAINRIDLPQGQFTAALATSRVTYTFTPRMFLGGLIQYNSAGDSLSTNVRFRWEYQPGSELFVVFNDQRDTSLRGAPMLETRAFIVKFTRLLRF